MFDNLRFLFDSDYRDALIGVAIERGLPMLLGAGIIIIGVAFVLSGTKTAQLIGGATGTVLETVATKGKSLVP